LGLSHRSPELDAGQRRGREPEGRRQGAGARRQPRPPVAHLIPFFLTMEAAMNVLDRRPILVAMVAMLVLCGAGAAGAGELLFYSSVPRNLSDVLVKGYEQDNPGTTVKMFQAGT